MQMCLGATYAWSVFVHFLRQTTGIGQGQAQLPFSVFYIAFPATVIVAGTLLERLGPQRCAMLGGLVFGGGWLLAGFGGTHFAFVVLGMGMLGGLGVGLAYLVPITTGVLWFPRQKGLVTGVAVAGFGGGAAIISKTANYLMTTCGATPFEAFWTFGWIFLLLTISAGWFMRYPPDYSVRHTSSFRPPAALRERTFWLLYLAMFAGLAAGFTVNANLKQLRAELNSPTGVTAVALFAITNALGRVCWGLVFDRARAATAIRANLALQAVLLLAAPRLLRAEYGLHCLALLAGFNYGGVLVLYAATAARRWGAQHVGRIYGWLFSANIPASLCPMLAGFAYDSTGSFTGPLLILACVLLGATLLVRRET
jgi:OFA family oxalate/formate antiporter-like MFS transporter